MYPTNVLLWSLDLDGYYVEIGGSSSARQTNLVISRAKCRGFRVTSVRLWDQQARALHQQAQVAWLMGHILPDRSFDVHSAHAGETSFLIISFHAPNAVHASACTKLFEHQQRRERLSIPFDIGTGIDVTHVIPGSSILPSEPDQHSKLFAWYSFTSEQAIAHIASVLPGIFVGRSQSVHFPELNFFPIDHA